MIEKLTKILSSIFAAAWCIIIFAEYWRYNPEYGKSIEYFNYLDLLVVFLLIGAAASWSISKIKTKPIKFINGLTVFAGLLILDIITMMFFYGKIPSLVLDERGLSLHLGQTIGVALAVFLIYLTARTAGQMLTTVFPLKVAPTDLPVIQSALGIMLLTFLLFFLGAFGLLRNWIVAPLLLIILLVDRHGTFQIIKKTLFQPLKITKGLNALGIFSFLFLGAFLIFDFVQILRPFPAGTDSINLYVNLPKLIGESGELVAGNQPYNWSLFMALGTVVFGRIDVTLALSFLGGFLMFRALYRLSRKWLSVNQSALCLVLFGTMPMTNFFLYRDMKIDLGLLFVTLCILLIFYNWVVPPKLSKKAKKVEKTVPLKSKKGSKQKRTKIKSPILPAVWLLSAKTFFANRIPDILKENHLLVIMGLLAGFAFGIKLTILFFLFAIGTAIWYSHGGVLAFSAAFFLSFGLVFILKLDAHPLLRDFHETVSILQWVLFAVGLGLTFYAFFRDQKNILKLLKSTAIIGAFFVLPILPWLIKNISETGQFTVEAVLNGKKATPNLQLKELGKLLKE